MTAGELLAASGLPALEARALLAHLTGWRREILIAFPEREPAADVAKRFAELAARRRAGEPLAYLLGSKEFYGRDFSVTPAVLVPRPETEMLVEFAVETLAGIEHPRIADLGTGSGIIAISVALERPGAQVNAVDISAAALEVARGNAVALGAAVDFRCGSWWSPLAGERFDLILSNPPYIAAKDEHLDVLGHEPRLALTDEGDGLACLRAIAAGAREHLKPGGWIAVEHGWDQGPATRALFEAAGLVQVSTLRDGAGLDRVTRGQAS